MIFSTEFHVNEFKRSSISESAVI